MGPEHLAGVSFFTRSLHFEVKRDVLTAIRVVSSWVSLSWTNGGGLFVFPLPAHHTFEMITFSYGSFILSLDIRRTIRIKRIVRFQRITIISIKLSCGNTLNPVNSNFGAF